MKLIDFLKSSLKEDKQIYDIWHNLSEVSQISQIAVFGLVTVAIYTVLIVIWI